MTMATDITIVGVGPYGLSIAAHLRAQGADFRIIGSTMQSWLSKMPRGMLLKSPGFTCQRIVKHLTRPSGNSWFAVPDRVH